MYIDATQRRKQRSAVRGAVEQAPGMPRRFADAGRRDGKDFLPHRFMRDRWAQTQHLKLAA
jgi:hypothetical protein